MVKGKQKHFSQLLFYSAEGHYKMKVFSILDLSKKWENKAADINIPTPFPAEWQRYKCTFIVQPTFCAFFLSEGEQCKGGVLSTMLLN